MFPRILLALCLLALLASSGCTQPDAAGPAGDSTSRTPTPMPAQVEIADFAYSPGEVRIQTGQQVTWTQKDAVNHTVTSDRGTPATFGSGDLASGDRYSQSFVKAGTYAYHCERHASMRGTVIVT